MRLTPDWAGPVFERLDRRLSRHRDRPLAVAVSGGGDSIALLHLTAKWAAGQNRRLVVLSVDHGLNSDSAAWNSRVASAASALGADWRGLAWTGDKPSTGLPAAARRARHALLAEAARATGARVILMGHTADDIAETDWMRERGTPLGHLKSWTPVPVWPEGRDLMLLRPLLDVSRQALRDWLTLQGLDWIDDPANSDPRFLRSRARSANPRVNASVPARMGPADLQVDGESGVIVGPVETAWLGPALACASGRESIPSAAALARLRERLARGAGAASLSGALIATQDGQLMISRECGRQPAPDLVLEPGVVHIWDGRFALRASTPGWRVGRAGGHQAHLSPGDRRRLSRLPPPARRSHPVLFRETGPRPVLADPSVEVTCLVAGRLRLAVGQVQTEDDL